MARAAVSSVQAKPDCELPCPAGCLHQEWAFAGLRSIRSCAMQVSGAARDVSFRFNFAAEGSAQPSNAAPAEQSTSTPAVAEAREIWPERVQVGSRAGCWVAMAATRTASEAPGMQPGNLLYDTVSLGPGRQLLKVSKKKVPATLAVRLAA